MDMLAMLAGPLIGALIGYITNNIAVKMLFRPLRPIIIGPWTLPFTPGIFPKRKSQLARALGKAVGNNLLTSEDVTKMFLAEPFKQTILREIRTVLYTREEQHNLRQLLSKHLLQVDYERRKEQMTHWLGRQILSGLTKIDLGKIITIEGSRVIKEKTEGSVLAMVINDKMIDSLVQPVGEMVRDYVEEHGTELVFPILREELNKLENQPLGNLVRGMDLNEEALGRGLDRIYTALIQHKVGAWIQQFDIAAVVEAKVNAMDVLEIERLVLSVMKKELNAVVNLGALIGLVIGLLNLLI